MKLLEDKMMMMMPRLNFSWQDTEWKLYGYKETF